MPIWPGTETVCFKVLDFGVWDLGLTQSLQYPVIKEYFLNHIGDPTII